MKGHPDHLLQWRICFTQAEISLVETFNDTQIKVYAVMKNLSKHVFKTVCRGVTSYVMKNVTHPIEKTQKKKKRIDFLEQVSLAPFALPPNDMADFLEEILGEPTPEKILDFLNVRFSNITIRK